MISVLIGPVAALPRPARRSPLAGRHGDRICADTPLAEDAALKHRAEDELDLPAPVPKDDAPREPPDTTVACMQQGLSGQPTAFAAATQSSFSSGVTEQFLALPPRAVLVIQ